MTLPLKSVAIITKKPLPVGAGYNMSTVKTEVKTPTDQDFVELSLDEIDLNTEPSTINVTSISPYTTLKQTARLCLDRHIDGIISIVVECTSSTPDSSQYSWSISHRCPKGDFAPIIIAPWIKDVTNKVQDSEDTLTIDIPLDSYDLDFRCQPRWKTVSVRALKQIDSIVIEYTLLV